MLILTNCLTDVTDEGCLKLSNSLIKRIKAKDNDTVVLSYDRSHALSDEHFDTNKLLLNRNLIKKIRQHKNRLLYIPFPANTLPTALRIFILSFFAKRSIDTVLVMKGEYGFLAKLLLKMSKSNIVVFSKDSYDFYRSFLKEKKLIYLTAGVDTQRFCPVSVEKKALLKEKYGFDKDRPVVLHVGHLNSGRNVQKLLDIDQKYQVVLVCSTLTKDEQDIKLKEELSKRDNIKIIETYIEHIEEVYALADVYFFPTQESGRCIDIPLSCMEAAACSTPVVATTYGELRQVVHTDGFYQIDKLERDEINRLIDLAINEHKDPRPTVLSYDWDKAVNHILQEDK